MINPINWDLSLPYFASCFLLAYFLGSIPFGFILTKFAGLGDIRELGSGNIGATNVLRTGRKGLAFTTLMLDNGKGISAVLLANCFGGLDFMVIAAWGVVLGHLFPFWLKFKGGKGVATTFGVILALHPLLGILTCVTWLVVAFALRYSSLAALVGTGLVPIYAWLLDLHQISEASIILTILVWSGHYENIRRLVSGREPKIGEK